MLQQILEYLKVNKDKIKKYLIYTLVLFLILSISVNSCQNKRSKEIKKENKELKEERKIYYAKLDSIDVLLKDRQQQTNILQLRSDSLKKVYYSLKSQMAVKEKEYQDKIKDLTNIPPDTIYKNILVYNPNINNDLLKYPFGSTQIRNIYGEHISLLYNEGLVKDLNKSLDLCNGDNNVKSSIILEKDSQLKLLNEKIKLNDNLITNLTDQNKVLDKSYKSERIWKKVWQVVSGIEGGLLIYQSIK